MSRLVLAILSGWLFFILVACGGDGGPSVRVLLEADLSQLPEGSVADEALEGAKDVLQRRLNALGVSGIEIMREGSNRLAVQLADIDAEMARELVEEGGYLEFRKPVLDEFLDIICETEDGSLYPQLFQPGLFVSDPANNAMTCPTDEEGNAGIVLWEPATGVDGQGVERLLTGGFLRPSAEVRDQPFGPAVLIEFTSEGSLLFEQITNDLVGLPLGIYLGEELIGAPTVQQPITGGMAAIPGLSADEARSLVTQINAVAPPVPLRIISIDETP